MKVMAFNSPKIAIFFAVIGVAIAGVSQPFLGWIFANLLFTLSKPVEFIQIELVKEGKSADLWKDELEKEVTWLAIYMVILGSATFVSYMLKSYLFSVLGENVTL
jgi:ABC-type multidrug transport system fused ATPase/permease subunit